MTQGLRLDTSQIHLRASFGTDRIVRKRSAGSWPATDKASLYELEPGELTLNWDKDILSGVFQSEEDLYLRQISLKVKVASPTRVFACGTDKKSPGISLSSADDTLRIKRNKNVKQIVNFSFSSHTVTIVWNFNCFLSAETPLVLDPLKIEMNSLSVQPLRPAQDSPAPDTRRKISMWLPPGNGSRGIRQDQLEDNLAWMEEQRLYFDLVMLDGIHSKIGDWDAFHRDYVGKIGFINRRIEHNGMMPGIAFSPFLAEAGSELVRVHPEWLCGDIKSDTPFQVIKEGKKVHLLDFTQKAVREHIKSTLDNLKKQWGFRAFHLKDLSYLTLAMRRQKMEICGGQLLFKALQFIRDALGEDAHISTQDTPMITKDGLISMMTLERPDKMKSGRDIAGYIHSIFSGRYISHYPWIYNMGFYPLPQNKLKLSLQAEETLKQMILLNGGILSINNDLKSLDEETKNELISTLESFKRFASGQVYVLKKAGKKSPCVLYNSNGYLGIFNMNRKKKSISWDMEELGRTLHKDDSDSRIKEGQTAMHAGTLELILPPYGSRIFKF